MPDKAPDYLQFALENIVKEISEVKTLISESSKNNSEFKDQILTRVTALEMRVNSIEVEKNTIKGLFSSDWFKKVLYFALVGLGGFITAKGFDISKLIEVFK